MKHTCQLSMNHNMNLNTLTCEEMVKKFIRSNNSVMRPIVIGSNVVRCEGNQQ